MVVTVRISDSYWTAWFTRLRRLKTAKVAEAVDVNGWRERDHQTLEAIPHLHKHQRAVIKFVAAGYRILQVGPAESTTAMRDPLEIFGPLTKQSR